MSTVRSLLLAACALALTGCGGPKHIDPPLFTESSPAAASLAAMLRAQEVGGRAYSVADTHSMEPLLFGGEFIVAQPVPFAALQLGQVVLYQATWRPAGSPPVCHRLVQHDRDGWILSGDNNPRSEPESRVTAENYIGLVVARYRAAK